MRPKEGWLFVDGNGPYHRFSWREEAGLKLRKYGTKGNTAHRFVFRPSGRLGAFGTSQGLCPRISSSSFFVSRIVLSPMPACSAGYSWAIPRRFFSKMEPFDLTCEAGPGSTVRPSRLGFLASCLSRTLPFVSNYRACARSCAREVRHLPQTVVPLSS